MNYDNVKELLLEWVTSLKGFFFEHPLYYLGVVFLGLLVIFRVFRKLKRASNKTTRKHAYLWLLNAILFWVVAVTALLWYILM